MRKHLILIFIFSGFLYKVSFTQASPYISPGIKFNFLPKKGIAFGLKISLGVYSSNNFFNITLGGQGMTFIHPKDDYSYTFLEFQYGSANILQPHASALSGGGVGIIIHHLGKKKVISPKINVFAGMIFFGELNFYRDENRKWTLNAGAEAVLPVPLHKEDFEFAD